MIYIFIYISYFALINSNFLLAILYNILWSSIWSCFFCFYLGFCSGWILWWNYKTRIWLSWVGSHVGDTIRVWTFAALVFGSFWRGAVWAWLGSARWDINWTCLHLNFLIRLICRISRCRNLRRYKSLPQTWSSSSSWLRGSFATITWHLLKLKRASSTMSSAFEIITLASKNSLGWQQLRFFFRFLK